MNSCFCSAEPDGHQRQHRENAGEVPREGLLPRGHQARNTPSRVRCGGTRVCGQGEQEGSGATHRHCWKRSSPRQEDSKVPADQTSGHHAVAVKQRCVQRGGPRNGRTDCSPSPARRGIRRRASRAAHHLFVTGQTVHLRHHARD